MGISIQVTYDGNVVPAQVLHDPNLQVDTETALNNLILANTGTVDEHGVLVPVTTIDGMPARYDVSDAAHKAGTIRRQQFGMGVHTTDDYHSGQTGADADALKFEAPYGFYSPSATVFLLCFDKNLDAGIINDVVYPINCEDMIVTPTLHSGSSLNLFTYMRNISIDIQSTSGGKCIISSVGATTLNNDIDNDIGSTTLKFTIMNIGKRINRIIMLRLSKYEIYRSNSRVTAPFICPKVNNDNMTLMYNSIHLLNAPSWFGIDSNNNLYIGQKRPDVSDNYMSSLYCISDGVTYDVISYFSQYFTALYSGVSKVRVNCAGLHNNLLLLTYTCDGYANDPYYGTARGNRTYYRTNFPDNVPIYSLDKTNNEFKRWGYADFSIIPDTYSRIMISGIGDRINGNENNILTFALFGYNSTTPTSNYFYVVNGTTALQLDGTYIFTATSYEKIMLDISGYTSAPDHCSCIYQANGQTFFKQSSSFLDSSNYRVTQKKDYGTYILNDIPTDGTVEITDNIKTVNFDCITESGGSGSGRMTNHKCLMPVSGLGGINKRAFVTDMASESDSYYKIVEPTYNVTPVVCDIHLQDGGVDIGANESIEFTMVVDANDELTYGED